MTVAFDIQRLAEKFPPARHGAPERPPMIHGDYRAFTNGALFISNFPPGTDYSELGTDVNWTPALAAMECGLAVDIRFPLEFWGFCRPFPRKFVYQAGSSALTILPTVFRVKSYDGEMILNFDREPGDRDDCEPEMRINLYYVYEFAPAVIRAPSIAEYPGAYKITQSHRLEYQGYSIYSMPMKAGD